MNPLDKIFFATWGLMTLFSLAGFGLWLSNRKSASYRNNLVGGLVGFSLCLLAYSSGIF